MTSGHPLIRLANDPVTTNWPYEVTFRVQVGDDYCERWNMGDDDD